MSFFGKWNTVVLSGLLLAVAAGCAPDSGPMDEEKEPHFVLGKSKVNAFNYTGAIEAFEESLEANPHSAKAHFELAMLYENQENDPAAAIYHYQQYLKYDATASNADLINQHIAKCKQQLAENVLQLPSAPAVQQQLEKLTEENRRLHDQLTQWQTYAAQLSTQLTARAGVPVPQYNNNNNGSPPRTSPTPDDVTLATSAYLATSASNNAAAGNSTTTGHKPPAASPRRTHTVASGETLASIARKHGVSVPALLSVNPGVNPKKLRSGQVLNLPEP